MAASAPEGLGVGSKSSSVGDGKADGKPVSVTHGTFRCKRGYDLHTTTYTPSVRRTSACLVFHHGLSDHSARHGAVLSHLCATHGMPVYTYDAHGHGRSGPPGPTGRTLIRSFDHMVGDLLDFTRQRVVPAEEAAERGRGAETGGQGTAGATTAGGAAATAGGRGEGGPAGGPRPRIYLMGYSMGGLTSCLAAAATMTPAAAPATTRSSYEKCTTTGANGNGSPYARVGNGIETCKGTNGNGAALSPSGAATGTSSSSANGAGGTNGAHGSSSAPATAPGNGSSGGSSGDGSQVNSLYEGLMLTSCLTDPLHNVHPVVAAVKTAMVTLLSYIVPALPFFKRNPVEAGIRDPAAVAEMAADTLWNRGSFKVATVASLLHGCARLRRCARSLAPLPLYVQHATHDVACSLSSLRAFLARVRPQRLTLHVVEGAFHDLFHDPETPAVLANMEAWLRARV